MSGVLPSTSRGGGQEGSSEPSGPSSGGNSQFLGALGMALKTICWPYFRIKAQ